LAGGAGKAGVSASAASACTKNESFSRVGEIDEGIAFFSWGEGVDDGAWRNFEKTIFARLA
jgi:hypothetical protein